jgi:hypothetical protein
VLFYGLLTISTAVISAYTLIDVCVKHEYRPDWV